jgi:hypothetical protein
MNRTALVVTGAMAAGLCLTACSGAGASPQSAITTSPTLPPTTSATPATSSAAAPSLNARGNLVKQLGQDGGFADAAGTEQVFTFAVDAITPDPVCDSGYAQEPQNGHYIAVDLRASTTANYTEQGVPVLFTADQFHVIGPDGITLTSLGGNSYSCIDDRRKITQDFLGDAQQYRGTVVLDSPVEHGTLIFLVAGAEGGWEWTF